MWGRRDTVKDGQRERRRGGCYYWEMRRRKRALLLGRGDGERGPVGHRSDTEGKRRLGGWSWEGMRGVRLLDCFFKRERERRWREPMGFRWEKGRGRRRSERDGERETEGVIGFWGEGGGGSRWVFCGRRGEGGDRSEMGRGRRRELSGFGEKETGGENRGVRERVWLEKKEGKEETEQSTMREVEGVDGCRSGVVGEAEGVDGGGR